MKRNNWFLASGILSIIEAVGCLFALFSLVSVVVAISNGTLTAEDISGIVGASYTIEVLKSMVIYMLFFIILAGASAVFTSVVYFKNMNRKLNEMKKGLVITAIVFSFIFSGILVGVLALVGYNSLSKSEQVTQTYSTNNGEVYINDNTTPAESETATRLKKLERMKADGLITEEEYNEQRKKIISEL